MEQGYFVEFYARANYVKHIQTKTGTPFVVGTLSAYVYKHGYTNVKFKCFGEIATQIENLQWIKGRGLLGYNVAQNQEEYKQLEIVIEDFELAEKPPFKDYTKDNSQSNKSKASYKPKAKITQDKTELEEELFGDIAIDDLPF